MAPQRRDLPPDELARLEKVRAEASSRLAELLADGPEADDPLGQLAWKAGTIIPDGPSDAGVDNDMARRIDDARKRRFTWREIALALGLSDEDRETRRIRERQDWRLDELGHG
jgi:hypothetical protein